MRASEHLEDRAWVHPKHYGGFSPDGDFLVITRHRNSDLLAEHNWETAREMLGAQWFEATGPSRAHPDNFNDRPVVYEWRAGCSLVGWIEYMMVRADAPDDVKEEAGEIICALADYLILAEDKYSEKEAEAAAEQWAGLSIRERFDLIKRYKNDYISIFEARHAWIPQGDSGGIYEACREGV